MPRRALVRLGVVAVCTPLLVSCSSGGGNGNGGASSSSRLPPALVQVENNSAARPQWGLQDAAVVYEYVTEGGISRFSVLYTVPPPGRIGPVRSARLVTIHLAQLFGAVVVYSGASIAVQRALDQSGVPRADEKAAHGDLYRIGNRPVPHNLVSDGDHLRDLLQNSSASTHTSLALWPRTQSPPPDQGRAATRFTVPVSQSEMPTFSYDAAAGGWHRSEPDTGSFVDADSGAAVVAATVIVQQVTIRQTDDVEDVNGVRGVDVTVTGSGRAQVFTAGREYDAAWTQPSSGPPSFTLAGGGRAPIAGGLVWICLVPTGSTAAAG
jgi:hypothetical protein